MNIIKALKITTLAENTVANAYLGQWGLSFLLDLEDARGDARKIVFDTGMNKQALLYNIRKLKTDLNDLDCVVLSHGHPDHTAATVEVVKATGGVKVYAHPHAFLPRFSKDKAGKQRRLEIPKGERLEDIERAGGKVLLSTEQCEVVPGVWTTGQIKRVTPFEHALPISEGEELTIIINGEKMEDQILDDQALWTQVNGVGSFVITGCAHAGPINTLLHIQKMGTSNQIHGLVGGTHLVGRSEDYLQQTIMELRQFKLKLISLCHCTGFKAAAKLWQAFPKEFIMNFSSRVIQAGKEPNQRVL